MGAVCSTDSEAVLAAENDLYKRIRKTFEIHDRNGDGVVTYQEAMEVFDDLAHQACDPDGKHKHKKKVDEKKLEKMRLNYASKFFGAADLDGDGTITTMEFVMACNVPQPLKAAFKNPPLGKDPMVTLEEARQAYIWLFYGNGGDTEGNSHRFVNRLDVTDDGMVRFREFEDTLTHAA